MHRFGNITVVVHVHRDALSFFHAEQTTWDAAIVIDGVNHATRSQFQFQGSDA